MISPLLIAYRGGEVSCNPGAERDAGISIVDPVAAWSVTLSSAFS
jgi:hypothetical protein